MVDEALQSALELYEKFTLPNGQVVFYSDLTHTYIVNGAEVPSITTLLTLIYGDTYAHVQPSVLQQAAEYGTNVHQELQDNIDRRLETSAYKPEVFQYPETQHYFTLVEPIWKIEPISTERVVVLYGPNNKPVAAGRFDLYCKVDGKLTLVDFKTTSTIHRQLVTAQLNLYRKAAIQSGYFSKEDNVKLGVIHLHGDTSRYVPVIVLPDNFYLQFII